jgi:outer membrane receptor protein involved in Fe transport
MIKNLIRTFALIISFSIFSLQAQIAPPSASREGGSIHGRIIDATDRTPIEYATIALYSSRDSSIVGGTISKANGSFHVEQVKPGKYYVVITFIGYERAHFNDIVISKEHPKKNLGLIKLKRAAAELEAVEIVAEQQFVEYHIDKKVVNVAGNLDAAGGSAVDALENVPSVSVDIDGNVSLRGSENFQVLINGKPSPLSSSDALQQIPAAAIKNIEIITNPSAKYDPDGMTGIVNIILKDNVQQGVNGLVEASVASFDTYNVNALLNYRIKRINYFVGVTGRWRNTPGGGHGEMDNFINPDTTIYRISDMERNRSNDNYTFKGGMDFYMDSMNTLSVEATYLFRENSRDYVTSAREYDMPQTFDTYSVSNNTGGRDSRFVKGSAIWDHNNKKKKEQWAGYFYFSNGDEEKEERQEEYLSDPDWNLSDIVLTGLNTTDERSRMEFRFKFDYSKQFKNKSKLESGFQSRIARENSDFVFNDWDTTKNEWVYRPDYSSKLDFNRDIYSVYTTYGGMYKNFGYQLGLRGEYTNRMIDSKLAGKTSTINRFDVFPTLHLSQKLGETHQVMAGYSRRIDRPGGWELDPNPIFISSNFVRIGNIDLEPEYTDNYELSYQKTFGRSFVSLEGYYRTTKNKVSRIRTVDQNNITYMTFANLDRDHSAGLEAMVNWRLTKWMKLNVSGTYYYYKIEENAASNTEERQSNNYRVNGNLSINLTRLMKLQITGFYRGPSVTAQGDIGSFAMMNAALRYDFFNRKLAATFKVRDIFQTMKHEITTSTDTFYSYNTFYRDMPIFSLTLSYRINNYKQKQRPEMREGGDDMDGMDM